MKLEFGALGICVNDIAKMVEFYRDALGTDIDRKRQLEEQATELLAKCGVVTLAIRKGGK